MDLKMDKSSNEEHSFLLQHSEGAPEVVSGKRMELHDICNILKEIMCCFIAFVVLIYISVFICICIILQKTNNSTVKGNCGGFWEFMIIALISPIIIPLFYFVYSCILFFIFSIKWRKFYGACMFVFGVASLHMCIHVSENQLCLESLRNSTPPLPWLLYAGWVKTLFFFSGSFSLLYDEYTKYNSM